MFPVWFEFSPRGHVVLCGSGEKRYLWKDPEEDSLGAGSSGREEKTSQIKVTILKR
jgi:hypothetical protein